MNEEVDAYTHRSGYIVRVKRDPSVEDKIVIAGF